MHPARPRNPGLDALRAFAITLVVVMHVVPDPAWVPPAAWSVLAFGSRGVDLFFVLSGYLVGGIALRELLPRPSGGAVLHFIRRRAYRTLPAYFVVFGLYLATLAFPHEADVPPLWPYLVFLQSYVGGPPQFFALSWSLCVEEHFYLALPVLLALGAALALRRPLGVGIALSVLSVGLVALRLWLPVLQVDEKLTHFRTDGLLVGVALAAVELARPRAFDAVARRPTLATASALGLVALAVVAQLRFEGLWQPSFALAAGGLVVLGAGGVPWLQSIGVRATVRWLARISYSLYLTHPLVKRALEKGFFGARFEQPLFAGAFVVLALGGSLAVAVALHRFVEAPMLARRDRRDRRDRPRPGQGKQ